MRSPKCGTPGAATTRSEYLSPTLGINTKENNMFVTIKQIIDAAELPRFKGRIVINKSQVYTVQICGMLCELDHEEGYSDYKIFDGTGYLKGRSWREHTTGSTFFSGAVIFGYYTVHGTVTVGQDGIALNTLQARKVHDFNEVTHHFLMCISNHIELMRYYRRNEKLQPATYHTALELDKEALISWLGNDEIRQSKDGASYSCICQHMQMDEDKLRSVLNELIGDGIIYNTVDDSHFKVADN